MFKKSDIPYGEKGPYQLLDIYLPDLSPHTVFVYFHGGRLEKGDKSIADVFAPFLAEMGVGVISANYRLYEDIKCGAKGVGMGLNDADKKAILEENFLYIEEKCRKMTSQISNN